MGRKKINPKDLRQNSVHLRFNDAEMKSIRKYLKKNNLKNELSPFIRKVVMAKVNQVDMFHSN